MNGKVFAADFLRSDPLFQSFSLSCCSVLVRSTDVERVVVTETTVLGKGGERKEERRKEGGGGGGGGRGEMEGRGKERGRVREGIYTVHSQAFTTDFLLNTLTKFNSCECTPNECRLMT